MSVPFKLDQSEYEYLSDRMGEEQKAARRTDETFAAFGRLAGKIEEETGFVVRRKADGVYGILTDVVEIPHDSMSEEAKETHGLERIEGITIGGVLYDGTSLPSRDDVVKELLELAEPLAPAFPDVAFEVAVDDDAFDGAAVIRAFVPEGSDGMARMGEINQAMYAIWDRLRGQNSAPTP